MSELIDRSIGHENNHLCSPVCTVNKRLCPSGPLKHLLFGDMNPVNNLELYELKVSIFSH